MKVFAFKTGGGCNEQESHTLILDNIVHVFRKSPSKEYPNGELIIQAPMVQLTFDGKGNDVAYEEILKALNEK